MPLLARDKTSEDLPTEGKTVTSIGKPVPRLLYAADTKLLRHHFHGIFCE